MVFPRTIQPAYMLHVLICGIMWGFSFCGNVDVTISTKSWNVREVYFAGTSSWNMACAQATSPLQVP